MRTCYTVVLITDICKTRRNQNLGLDIECPRRLAADENAHEEDTLFPGPDPPAPGWVESPAPYSRCEFVRGSLPFFVQVLDIAGLVPIILIDESHPRLIGEVGDESSSAGAGGKALLGACMFIVVGESIC
jgi:hypothetical protein